MVQKGFHTNQPLFLLTPSSYFQKQQFSCQAWRHHHLSASRSFSGTFLLSNLASFLPSLPPPSPPTINHVSGCFQASDCVVLSHGYISYLFSSVLFLELGTLPLLIFFDHLRLFPPSDLSVGFPVRSAWARRLAAPRRPTPAASASAPRSSPSPKTLTASRRPCPHPLLIT